MSSRNGKLVIGCLLGVVMSALTYFLWFGPDADKGTTARDNPSSAANSIAGGTNARARTASGSLPVAHSRAPTTLQPVTLSKVDLEKHGKFWMLGYSEQDIGWLTRYGYPTLEEESRLGQATTEQLSALAEAGNLNAKVHLGVRLAAPALKSNDARSLMQAKSLIEQSLIEGGPYQAAKTAEFFVSLAKNRREFGDLSETQRAALQNELLPLYDLSKGISALYGDFAAVRAVNEYRNIGPMFGLPDSQPMQFEFAMARLANMNKERVRRRLEPYDVVQRPLPPGQSYILSFEATNTVFVR